LGDSPVEDDFLEAAELIQREARFKGCCLLLPQDVLVNSPAGSSICDLEKIERGEVVSYVGPATVKRWGQEVCQAKTVVWNGPLGVFEVHPFHTGTLKLAKVVAERENTRYPQKGAICPGVSDRERYKTRRTVERFFAHIKEHKRLIARFDRLDATFFLFFSLSLA